nr:MAG TPA: hypothetical protein [Inoviridae sp.]
MHRSPAPGNVDFNFDRRGFVDSVQIVDSPQ